MGATPLPFTTASPTFQCLSLNKWWDTSWGSSLLPAPSRATSKTRKEVADAMTSSTSTAATAQAHGRFIRGSASKVRRVLDQIRGRTYRDALIMLEFMPYRSTGPITKVLRSAVANAKKGKKREINTKKKK